MTVSVNKDEALVKAIREAQKANGGYCCCAIEKTDDTRCICKEFREQIDRKQPGKCPCGLYEIKLD